MANSKDSLNWEALRSASSVAEEGGAAQAGLSQNSAISGPERMTSDDYGPGHPALYYDGRSAKGRRVRF